MTRVSLDLDGVLFPSPDKIAQAVKDKYQYEDRLWTHYDINDSAHPSHIKKYVIECYKNPVLMAHGLHLEDNVCSSVRLLTMHHPVFVVSSRRLHRIETLARLESFLPSVDGIVFSDGRLKKHEAIRGLKIHYHVDDDAEECNSIAENTKCRPILILKEYNVDVTLHERVIPVESLADAIYVIRGVKEVK